MTSETQCGAMVNGEGSGLCAYVDEDGDKCGKDHQCVHKHGDHDCCGNACHCDFEYCPAHDGHPYQPTCSRCGSRDRPDIRLHSTGSSQSHISIESCILAVAMDTRELLAGRTQWSLPGPSHVAGSAPPDEPRIGPADPMRSSPRV